MECGSSFPSPQALEAHMRLAHVPSGHSCPQCGLAFKDSWHLKRHMFSHGGGSEPEQGKNMCVLCNAIFPDSWSLAKHMQSHEPGSMGPGMQSGFASMPPFRKRGRGRPRGSSSIRHMTPDMMPNWSDPNPVYFNDPFPRRPARYDSLEFYCGICGESLGRSKFSSHSLNHFHDIFEVRRPPGSGEAQPVMEPEAPGECLACREMARKVRAITEMQ